MTARGGENTEIEEVRQLARANQYDRYVAALLLARRYREALILLAAYAGELQRVPFIVSEPMMAAVRLQWWRDALTAAAAPSGDAQRSGHLLCDALVDVARAHRLPFGLLQGMIDAAETELDPTPFAEPAEVEQVLIKFEGALFELAGRVLGSEAPRAVWQEAALAYGKARLGAEFGPRRDAGAQTYLSRTCTGPEQSFIEPARAALEALGAQYPALDAATKGALLPLATVAPVLRGFATKGQQIDATKARLSAFTRARLILWAHWRGRI